MVILRLDLVSVLSWERRVRRQESRQAILGFIPSNAGSMILIRQYLFIPEDVVVQHDAHEGNDGQEVKGTVSDNRVPGQCHGGVYQQGTETDDEHYIENGRTHNCS